MNNKQGNISCALGCWLVAALGGLLAAVLLWVIGGWSFMQGAFAGIVVAVVAGLLLSWIMCKPLPAIGEATVGAKDEDAAAKPTAPPAKAEEPAPQAAAAAAPAASAASKPEIKPSAPLAGQEELAARKGEWKYEGDAPAEAKKKPAAKAKAKPKAKAAPKAEATAEAAGPGKKPETLSAARDGGPDNLKQIKGVGPKLEALLHSMGFYHFDQVASWGADEVAWVDQNLEGFKGRVTRDEWVSQAKILAEGGTTEFSSKVKKGGVY
ncbi:endonuclease [Tateyamaria sp. SN3-11]|uniref:endonuclease n=1 Tax=Tateyamaria sp. SN3-11 TaxID=3092147 RepID=UPI0039EB24DA